MLLPPLLAGATVLCLLLAVATSFGQRAKADNPLAQSTPDEIVRQLAVDLEGTPTRTDIRRARRPLSERRRRLDAHPYVRLYTLASAGFGVSRYLVAAVHYQETGFAEAPATLAGNARWLRHLLRDARIERPDGYPNRARRHPSVRDDFDVVMAIAEGLKARGARSELDATATRALAGRYGPGPGGRLTAAMVLEHAARGGCSARFRCPVAASSPRPSTASSAAAATSAAPGQATARRVDFLARPAR